MLLSLLQFFATKFLVLALHLEAGSFPKPLNAREEIETFAALRAGDRSAREKLIRHNLRLVAHVAKKYYAQPTEQEDLISIGTIGLMKAVDTFDTTRKARFSTYASRCIENAILTRANARREDRNRLHRPRGHSRHLPGLPGRRSSRFHPPVNRRTPHEPPCRPIPPCVPPCGWQHVSGSRSYRRWCRGIRPAAAAAGQIPSLPERFCP